MEIKLTTILFIERKNIPKIIVKTILFLCVTTLFGFSTDPIISQNAKVTIDSNKTATIFEVFDLIGEQTECTFIYQSDILKDLPEIHLKKGVIKVIALLKKYLPEAEFTISVTKNSHITISRQVSKKLEQSNLQIKGIVNDVKGVPIVGVNIVVEGTNRGTVSNFDGSYSIDVKPTGILVFSALGYITQSITVNNRTEINVQLQKDVTQLDAVSINAGYYSVKEKERTGNISSVSAKEIEKQPVNNPLEALQGRLAGVDIVESSGVPGSGFTVRIRGQNSILGGNEPLYIIDGVPYDSRSLSDLNVSFEVFPEGNISPLNAINPATIESIEVLKDADATAIYGSRGANGVVLITTKKGKFGKTKFTINSSTGFSQITRKLDLLNTPEYLAMRREAFANDGITEIPETAYDLNGTWDINRYTDWQEELLGGTAFNQDLQASISGGNETTRFLLSGMYHEETTVFPGNFKYDRWNFNSNITHSSPDNKFDLLVSTSYTLEDNSLPKRDLTYDAIYLPPNAPELYDETGELNWENSTWTNPLAALEAMYTNNTAAFLSNAVVTYKPFVNLETKIRLGYANNRIDENYISPHTIFDPAFGLDSSASQLFENSGTNKYIITESQVEWKKDFKNGDLKVLLGSTFQKNESAQQAFIGIGFPNNQLINNLTSATNLIALNENEQVYSYQSFFARVNYGFQEKLFLNLTGRRDGSSRFSPGNRYGNFGAVGTAWLFSEDLKFPWLNLGKLRASYGITGNDQIGDYQYLQTYTISDSTYDGNIGLEAARLYNPNFKWEENRKAELALELGLWENRLSLNVSYYRNRSSNQLIQFALPATTGFTSILANLDAVVENTGFEIGITGVLFRGNHFSWTTSVNLTLPKNELLEFPNLENSTYANRFVIGEPLNIVKLYNLKGVNPETGLFEFEDYNGDGEITIEEDREFVADLSPKFYGGISNSIQYKDWSLDFLFQFVKKDGFNQFNSGIPPGTMLNQPKEVLDRWMQSGDEAFMQQFTTGANSEAFLAYSQFSQSSGIVSDASFIRLKSLNLSYNVPLNNSSGASCRVSLRGQNLLTFTKFKGGDPEQTNGYIPSLRQISLGLQIAI